MYKKKVNVKNHGSIKIFTEKIELSSGRQIFLSYLGARDMSKHQEIEV